MKKLALLTLSVSSLMLFSFYRSDKGIRKLSDKLWEVTSTQSMSAQDQKQFNALIQKEYGLKDFKTERTLEFKTQAAKWWAVTNKKWGPTFFKEKAVAGEGKEKMVLAGQHDQLAKILEKYAPK